MKGTALYDYSVEHGLIDASSYNDDMSGCSEKSALSCFNEHEKNVRHNIYSLGAALAKLPFPLDKIAIALIKIIPSNKLFVKTRRLVYEYYIANKIFKRGKTG